MATCKSIGCNYPSTAGSDFCHVCERVHSLKGWFGELTVANPELAELADTSLATKYPKYYKDVQAYSDIDVYAVHLLFDVQDASGALQHASKKLLLSGVRTGGKTKRNDIEEARDTLTRWLELHG